VICFASDYQGYQYSAIAYTASEAQEEALLRCERESGSYCSALGCRLYERNSGD
jgi:hypothetical protein